MKKNLLFILIIIIISIPAILLLFQNGFFVTDDGEWLIIRFSAFYSAFKDGQIPVRFLHTLNSGYGYPVPTFLYPGFMYLGIPIQIITSNFVNTIKIIIGFSLIFSTIFNYLWLNKIFSKTASFIGAAISLYIPYHLYDAYIRGSVGELLALVWITFVFWMIEKNSLFFTAIGIALLILSHNTLALLFLPIIIVYLLLKIINRQNNIKDIIIRHITIIFAGIGMAAFFIIPSIFELQYTRFNQTQVSNPMNYFAYFNLVGLISFLIIILSVAVIIYKTFQNRKQKSDFWIRHSFIIFFIILSLFAVILSTEFSTPLWKVLPASWIQFPFRILSYLIIAIPFLTAYIITEFKGLKKYITILFIIILLVLSARQYIAPKDFFNKGDEYYFTNQATTTVQHEYVPLRVKKQLQNKPDKKVEIINGKGIISNLIYNNNKIYFLVESQNASTIQINTIFWPGWSVSDNGYPTKINYSNTQGVMQLKIPKGRHEIKAVFSETPLRLISDLISFISIILLIYLCKLWRK